MPRVSREQSEHNRREIERVSSELFRAHGIGQVSVNDLMAAAGLTHGGFYGHFESKDALAAKVCSDAFDAAVAKWHERVERHSDHPAAAFKLIVDGYLSERARDNPGTACPATTLASDVTWAAPQAPVRRSFVDGMKGLLDELERVVPAASRDQALVAMATLVGAQMLARACRGDALADDFLAAARDGLNGVGAPAVRN